MSYQDTAEKQKFLQDNLKETTKKIVSFISQFRQQNNIEYEIRIGHLSDHFNTNIHQRHFNIIKEKLDSLMLNDKKVVPVITEYTAEFDDQEHRRINNDIIKKTRLDNMNFTIDNSPFDIRISVAREEKTKNFGPNIIHSIKKVRHSYVYKEWTYDLTVSDESNYSVEIEMDPKKIKDKKNLDLFIYSTLLKVKDLSLICEKDSIPGIFIEDV